MCVSACVCVCVRARVYACVSVSAVQMELCFLLPGLVRVHGRWDQGEEEEERSLDEEMGHGRHCWSQ